ncbi:MAG: hypothetical protein ACLFSV_10755, partial [Alkalispirochaeta sp.]
PGVAVAGDGGAAAASPNGPDRTPTSIHRRLEHHLPPAALPTSITIGPTLPRDANGKLTDW